MRAETRVLLAGALFATGGVLIKSCDFPSLQRAGLRAALAAATLFALLPTTRRWPSWRMLLLVPAYFGATCLFVVANTLTTAADAIFLQSTAPLWLVLLGPLLLHERPTRRDVVTLVGIAAGMLLCFLAPGTAQATAPEPRLGGAIALASGVCYALLLLGLRWLGRRPDAAGSQPPGASLTPRDEGPAAIAWGNACTFPIAFALMPVVGQTPIAGSAQDWLVIAVLGSCQVGLAYALLARALPQVPAMQASLLLMIEPALNPLLAFLGHGELPHGLVFAGGALILAATLGPSLWARRG
jgi:drug/metabolite transporter (DMT)-like permease